MDVERGARQRRDDGEWVERLERHLVQLSSDLTIAPTLAKLRRKWVLNIRHSVRSRNHTNAFAALKCMINKVDQAPHVTINRKYKHPLLLLK